MEEETGNRLEGKEPRVNRPSSRNHQPKQIHGLMILTLHLFLIFIIHP
jgi:hypothetical protein